MVDVRKIGVSTRPHSAAARKPVHSPALFSTAPPAGTGLRNMLPPRSITVTPVRAIPRPAGVGGSSRHTVACPTPTPGTSTIDAVCPLGSVPILMPRLAARVIRRSSLTPDRALLPGQWSGPARLNASGAARMTTTPCRTRPPVAWTLVGPGGWEAIRAAADAALTAAGLVAAGDRVAYALCRPPGHHTTRSAYGGSCYLNNAAMAAQALRESGAERVAVIDIDAQHGNGTQAIFYDRPDVYYGSLHVDPGAGWFPHYAGYPDERGNTAGTGANRNLPLAPGTGDDGWLAAIELLVAEVRDLGTDAVVVSLGVDAAAADPESPLQVSADGYRRAGELIGALAPIVAVQEGGQEPRLPR